MLGLEWQAICPRSGRVTRIGRQAPVETKARRIEQSTLPADRVFIARAIVSGELEGICLLRRVKGHRVFFRRSVWRTVPKAVMV